MQTLAVGSPDGRRPARGPLPRSPGFTLLELLVVLAIIAIGSAGVGFALRDSAQTRLEREALRLGALLESARARSQVNGVPVRWRVTSSGFRFEGLSMTETQFDLPQVWLDPDTRASVERVPGSPDRAVQSLPLDLFLGPDPIIGPQAVTVYSLAQPQQRVRLSSDGVRPFAVVPSQP